MAGTQITPSKNEAVEIIPSSRIKALSLKNGLSVIAGCGATYAAVIPIVFEHLTSAWKGSLVGAGVVAVMALVGQAVLQSREDGKRDKEDARRDELLSQITEQLQSWSRHPEPIPIEIEVSKQLGAEHKGDDVFDGEIYPPINVYPVLGVPYQLLREIWATKGESPPRVKTDVLIHLYVVNKSAQPAYIKDFILTYQAGGEAKTLRAVNDFSVDALSIDDRMMEYCYERDDKKVALDNLANKRNSQLATKEPIEGWLRFQTTENPELLIGPRVFSLFIEDSVGTRHEVTRVSDRRDQGEITYRQVGRLNL